MKKQAVLFGISGLVLGIAITWITAAVAVNGNHTSLMSMMGMKTTSSTDEQKTMNDADMSMSQMTNNLKNKTGDDFDKAFTADMIAHHQGAIDMANLAKANAKHAEIKSLADDIVSAQTKEIDQMKMWQAEWGYTTSSSNNHDMMNMGH